MIIEHLYVYIIRSVCEDTFMDKGLLILLLDGGGFLVLIGYLYWTSKRADR